MKLLKKILITFAIFLVAVVVLGVTASFWCYRRFCDLDSHFYAPSAEIVVRLTIDRSFDPPLSFTVTKTKKGATLEACVLPAPYHFTFSYVTRSLADPELKKIINLVERADIPGMGHTKQLLYMDGSTWNIGVARHGTVEKVSVRCPDVSTDNVRYANLVELGKTLNEYSDFVTATERLLAIPGGKFADRQPPVEVEHASPVRQRP